MDEVRLSIKQSVQCIRCDKVLFQLESYNKPFKPNIEGNKIYAKCPRCNTMNKTIVVNGHSDEFVEIIYL